MTGGGGQGVLHGTHVDRLLDLLQNGFQSYKHFSGGAKSWNRASACVRLRRSVLFHRVIHLQVQGMYSLYSERPCGHCDQWIQCSLLWKYLCHRKTHNTDKFPSSSALTTTLHGCLSLKSSFEEIWNEKQHKHLNMYTKYYVTHVCLLVDGRRLVLWCHHFESWKKSVLHFSSFSQWYVSVLL